MSRNSSSSVGAEVGNRHGESAVVHMDWAHHHQQQQQAPAAPAPAEGDSEQNRRRSRRRRRKRRGPGDQDFEVAETRAAPGESAEAEDEPEREMAPRDTQASKSGAAEPQAPPPWTSRWAARTRRPAA